MVDPQLSTSVVIDIAAGLVLAVQVIRAIAVKVRAQAQRRRNRRWVRSLPARPSSPDHAGRSGIPMTADAAVRPAPRPAASAVSHSQRQRVLL